MGNIITADGMRPDDAKITAISEMPDPTDKAGIQRLLGTVNFLAAYIPNMSEITAPLRSLLRKNVMFIWEHEQKQAVQKIKDALTKNPVLRFYDVDKDVTIQCDSSCNGLGACLLQDGHPVAYASRALTSAEQNYAMCEKELLSVVFATSKFHDYIYGKTVEVHNDHRPLESIMRKGLNSAPARLTRMLLRLQKYDINFKYVPGKHMYIADTLSRVLIIVLITLV